MTIVAICAGEELFTFTRTYDNNWSKKRTDILKFMATEASISPEEIDEILVFSGDRLDNFDINNDQEVWKNVQKIC